MSLNLDYVNPHTFATEYKETLFQSLLIQYTNQAIIVDPDLFKHYFEDFREETHQMYSQLSDEFFDYVLKHDLSRKQVLYTAGGSGSGKTEIVVKNAIETGFEGVVVDGTLANFERAVIDIDKSIMWNKKILINGVLPDLILAYRFIKLRENHTGRPVPIEVFLKKHAGFFSTFPQLINKYAKIPNVRFRLTDIRNCERKVTYTDTSIILSYLEGAKSVFYDLKPLLEY